MTLVATLPDLIPDNPPSIPSGSPIAQYHSQDEQDRWVIERVFRGKRNGYFIEMGAADGVLLSNTYTLERAFGWKGLLIEPTGKFYDLETNRSAACEHCCVGSVNSEVFIFELPGPGNLDRDPTNTLRSITINACNIEEARQKANEILPKDVLNSRPGGFKFPLTRVKSLTLESLLKKHNSPKEIDFLSLDVEGHEYEVLQNFPFEEYLFKSMVIERPSRELRLLLHKYNYQAVGRNKIGDIFYIHETYMENYLSGSYED